MKESLDAWYNRYAILALFVVVGFVGYDRICWQGLTASDWGTWTGAIFAGLAFAGTIWISTTETRRRHSEEKAKAMIAAPAVLMKILDVGPKIEVSIKALTTGPVDLARAFIFCQDQLNQVDLWSAEDLIPFASLPGRCATKLAVGLEVIRLSKQVFANRDVANQKNADSAVATLSSALRDITEAGATLKKLISIDVDMDSILR